MNITPVSPFPHNIFLNNENIIQKVPQIVSDNTSIIKNKKIEITNIIKNLNTTIEKIEKNQRTITRNGAILYGNIRKLMI